MSSDRSTARWKRATPVVVTTLVALAVASPVAAHPGHGAHAETGFASGLLHPLTGVDHLLAILAVGVVAVLVPSRRAPWAVPLGFVAGLAAGGALGLVGGVRDAVELAIAASVVLLGLMVVSLTRWGPRSLLPSVLGVVSVLGVAHGYGHGVALPAGAAAVDYAVGALIATGALLALGTALGIGLRRTPAARIAAGWLVSVAGVALVVGAA